MYSEIWLNQKVNMKANWMAKFHYRFFNVYWNLFWEGNLKVMVYAYNIVLKRFVGRFVNTAHLIQNVKSFTLLLGYILINTRICTFWKCKDQKKNKKNTHTLHHKTIALWSEVSVLISKHTWLYVSRFKKKAGNTFFIFSSVNVHF